MRHTHLSLQPLTSSSSVFSFLKIALLGAILFIFFPNITFAALMDSYTFSTSTYPLVKTEDCRGSADLLGHCPMSIVSPFWTAGSAYTLTSVASNLGLNLANTLPIFQTALGSTLIRFQLMKLAGFTRIACYSEYKTVDEWLAFGVGYNENGFSYNPAQHNFNLGIYPEISFMGTECALTAGESYAVQPELSWQTLAGTFAFSNPTAPSPPGGVGLAPILYDIYGSPTEPPPTGLSNVLFLPGLEASRLYMQKSVLGMQMEDQLWESNKKADVEDLYLNPDGTSKKSGIYTRDAIKETNTPFATGFAGQNIYKTFFGTLDSLTDHELPEHMARWEAYAYDWRQSVDDIVNSGTSYQAGQKSLIETLENLAASSTTGKVTIIGHSNGGLLAKALMVKLQHMKDVGESNLVEHIDTVILVASPQIGTAAAVPVMLHGYDQKIAGGILIDEEHARELGRNMPGAYGLLPSKEYINRIDISPVTFTGSGLLGVVTTPYISAYGSTTDSYPEYKGFLLGQEGRVDPATNAIKLPIKLSEALLNKAESLHDSIDAWVPPAGVRVVEVAGWGLDTVASFSYVPKYSQTCVDTGLFSCYVLDQQPVFTVDGDRTVVEPSALYMGGEKYWVDIKRYNRFRPGPLSAEHKNILEIDQLNNLVSSIIKNQEIVYNEVVKGIKPVDDTDRLRISIHSPVSIGSYDPLGNFTGKVCVDTEDFCYIQEDIPNSSYLEFGEGKYINMPEENLQKVVLQGTGTGTFTYISEKVTPEGQTTTSTFSEIPVTTQTQGEVVLNTVTQVPELKLDVTGDGTVDFTLVPTAEFDPVIFLQIMKQTIESFDIKQARKTTLSKRIDGIIKSIQKGKIPKAQLKAERFQNALKIKVAKPLPKKPKPQRLTNADAEVLIGMLETLLNNLEK